MFLAINLAKSGFLEESLSFNKHSVGWGKYEGVREREEYKNNHFWDLLMPKKSDSLHEGLLSLRARAWENTA